MAVYGQLRNVGWMYASMEAILLDRRAWRKGLYFGFTAILLVWLIVLRLDDAGLFGIKISATLRIGNPAAAFCSRCGFG